MIINKCGHCGNEIKTYPSQNKKFCNNDCRNADYRNRKGKEASAWRGAKATYSAIHKWVNKHFNKPCRCEQCGSNRYIDWANISGEHKRVREDWLALCRSCHFYYDGRDKVLRRYK